MKKVQLTDIGARIGNDLYEVVYSIYSDSNIDIYEDTTNPDNERFYAGVGRVTKYDYMVRGTMSDIVEFFIELATEQIKSDYLSLLNN